MIEQLNFYFIQFLEYGFYLGLFFLVNLFIYDRFVQRRHQLLINYPVIGRMRYLFLPKWDAPIEAFPEDVPKDMPDLILQIGSGLYGVRDESGKFDLVRYVKSMRFCKMTEIKIAQGAKQTGGKIMAAKASADIAYYRGVEEGKDLISPNRFPYANTPEELFDFTGTCQDISGKPVGMKVVVSDTQQIEKMVKILADRKKEGKAIPDHISIDSAEGGSARAPLELMESIGLTTNNALYIVDIILKKYGIRDSIRLIASRKILTPDDAAITLSVGTDAVAIARGFMMSGRCIRARVCNGADGHVCPVGLATQDARRRASYLVVRKSNEIANYHKNMIKGIKTMLSVTGLPKVSMLSKESLSYKNSNGEIYFDIDQYFHHKLHV